MAAATRQQIMVAKEGTLLWRSQQLGSWKQKHVQIVKRPAESTAELVFSSEAVSSESDHQIATVADLALEPVAVARGSFSDAEAARVFVVRSTSQEDTTLVLLAPSTLERDAWVEALRDAGAQDGTPAPLSRDRSFSTTFEKIISRMRSGSSSAKRRSTGSQGGADDQASPQAAAAAAAAADLMRQSSPANDRELLTEPMDGFFLKRNPGGKGPWKRKWLSLKGDYVVYSNDRDHADPSESTVKKIPLGLVAQAGPLSPEDTDESPVPYNLANAFEIRLTSGGSLHFQAPTSLEMRRAVANIRRVLDDPMGTRSASLPRGHFQHCFTSVGSSAGTPNSPSAISAAAYPDYDEMMAAGGASASTSVAPAAAPASPAVASAASTSPGSGSEKAPHQVVPRISISAITSDSSDRDSSVDIVPSPVHSGGSSEIEHASNSSLPPLTSLTLPGPSSPSSPSTSFRSGASPRNQSTIIQGILRKKTKSSLFGWKDRFFRLADNGSAGLRLLYFKDQSAGELKGYINLGPHVSIDPTPQNVSGISSEADAQCCFALHSSGITNAKVTYILAASPAEKVMWIEAIQQALERAGEFPDAVITRRTTRTESNVSRSFKRGGRENKPRSKFNSWGKATPGFLHKKSNGSPTSSVSRRGGGGGGTSTSARAAGSDDATEAEKARIRRYNAEKRKQLPTHEGALLLKRRNRMNDMWKDRYYVLRDGVLQEFKQRYDTDCWKQFHVHNMLRIYPSDHVPGISAEQLERCFTLEVDREKDTPLMIYLLCENVDQMLRWVEVLTVSKSIFSELRIVPGTDHFFEDELEEHLGSYRSEDGAAIVGSGKLAVPGTTSSGRKMSVTGRARSASRAAVDAIATALGSVSGRMDDDNQSRDLRILGSFVPEAVVKRFSTMHDPLQAPETSSSYGTVLFADISGFTPLAERLSKQGGAEGGAEQLSKHLNAYFGQIIYLIRFHGGDIIKFAGDAVLATWSAGSKGRLWLTTLTATQCAITMQKNLADWSRDNVRLQLHVGIGAGQYTAFHVGGTEGQWEYFIAGPPLVQISAAEALAKNGEVVVSHEAWQLVREHVSGTPVDVPTAPGSGMVSPPGGAAGAGDSRPCFRVQSIKTSLPQPNVPMLNVVPESETALRGYLQPGVNARLRSGHARWLAELRKVSVMFMRFPDLAGGNEDIDEFCGLVQNALVEVQRSTYHHGGTIRQLITDDKGCVLISAFGLPPHSYANDPARCIRAALEVQNTLKTKHHIRTTIGITTGTAFCGWVGSELRREYAMVGDVVNLSARLMMKAEDNTILCDRATFDSCANVLIKQERIHFRWLAPIIVKGKEAPVPVFQPTGTEHVRNEDMYNLSAMQSKLVGHDSEREAVLAKLKALGAGKASSVCILEGDAGMGKTMILEELVRTAKDTEGVAVVSANADEMEQSCPFFTLRQLLTTLMRLDGLQGQARRERVLEYMERYCKAPRPGFPTGNPSPVRPSVRNPTIVTEDVDGDNDADADADADALAADVDADALVGDAEAFVDDGDLDEPLTVHIVQDDDEAGGQGLLDDAQDFDEDDEEEEEDDDDDDSLDMSPRSSEGDKAADRANKRLTVESTGWELGPGELTDEGGSMRSTQSQQGSSRRLSKRRSTLSNFSVSDEYRFGGTSGTRAGVTQPLSLLAPLLGVAMPQLEFPNNDVTRGLAGTVRADNALDMLLRMMVEDQDKALLLVLENGQWFDHSTWTFVLELQRYLARFPESRLMLVVAMRPLGYNPPPQFGELLHAPLVELHVLRPFDRTTMRHLVSENYSIVEEKLPARVLDMLMQKSSGNPFFALEIFFRLYSTEVININATGNCNLAANADDLDSFPIPDSVQGIVRSRIDTMLTTSQQITLKVASVIGLAFSYKCLEHVHPISREKFDLDRDLGVLEMLGFIRQVQQDTGDSDEHREHREAVEKVVKAKTTPVPPPPPVLSAVAHSSAGQEAALALATASAVASSPRSSSGSWHTGMGRGSWRTSVGSESTAPDGRSDSVSIESASTRGRANARDLGSAAQPEESDEEIKMRQVFMFNNGLTYQIAHKLLLFQQRRDLNQAIAEFYEDTLPKESTSKYALIAQHYSRAEVPDKALYYLEHAGQVALLQNKNREAVEHFVRAMSFLPEDADLSNSERVDKASILQDLAEAYIRLGSMSLARESLEEALKVLDLPLPRKNQRESSLLSSFGTRKWPSVRTGGRKQSVSNSHMAANTTYAKLAHVYYLMDERSRFADSTIHYLQGAEELASSEDQSQAYAMLSLAARVCGSGQASDGYAKKAMEAMDMSSAGFVSPPSALALGAQTTPTSPQGNVYMTVALSLLMCGTKATGLAEYLMRAQDLFAKIGERRRWRECVRVQSLFFYHVGEYEKSHERAVALMEDADCNGDVQAHYWAAIGQARAHLAQGQANQALKVLMASQGAIKAVQSNKDPSKPDPRVVTEMCALQAVARMRLNGRTFMAVETIEQVICPIVPSTITYTMFISYAFTAEVYMEYWIAAISEGDSAPIERKKCERMARNAVEALGKISSVFPIAQASYLLWHGMQDWINNKTSAATKSWSKGVKESARAGLPFEEAIVCHCLGRTSDVASERAPMISRAAEICQRIAIRYEDLGARLDFLLGGQAGESNKAPPTVVAV